jgi:hypothetical protein
LSFKVLGFKVWWFFGFYMVLGRMVDNGHDNSLSIIELQGSPTSITDYEHLRDFGVKNGDGISEKNLPNIVNN